MPLENPPKSLLLKLGAIVVYAKAINENTVVHNFNRIALTTLLDDPEVQEWMSRMDAEGHLPEPRGL